MAAEWTVGGERRRPRRRAAVAGAAHAVSLAVTGPELSAEHGSRAWKQIGGGELRVTGRSSAR